MKWWIIVMKVEAAVACLCTGMWPARIPWNALSITQKHFCLRKITRSNSNWPVGFYPLVDKYRILKSVVWNSFWKLTEQTQHEARYPGWTELSGRRFDVWERKGNGQNEWNNELCRQSDARQSPPPALSLFWSLGWVTIFLRVAQRVWHGRLAGMLDGFWGGEH